MKVSIIIPCYNVEKYIDRCLKSVVSQTIGIENLEIILVDDASTDNTLEKLLAWEKRFPNNLEVITYEKNLKQGGARNVGINYATAEYIGFLDADDWIELDMYELLYNKAEETKCDWVRGKFVREGHIGIGKIKELPPRNQHYRFSGIQGFYMGYCIDTGDNGEFGSICTGIYRKDIITKNNIHFPEGMVYEDNYWEAVLRLYIQNCYIVDKVLYHYETNESTTSKKNSLHHLDRLKIELLKLEKYNELGIMQIPQYKEIIEREFIQLYYLNTMFIIFTRFSVIPIDIINIMIDTVNSHFPDWEENPAIQNIDILEKMLLELLKTKQHLLQEDIDDLRMLYLDAWKEYYHIY